MRAFSDGWAVWFEDPTNGYRIWWWSQWLSGNADSPWEMPLLLHPHGLRMMWMSNGAGKELLAALLGGGAAPWLAINLITLTTPPLTGLAAFAVLRRWLKGAFLPALAGGWLAAWNATYTIHFVNAWIASTEGLIWFLGLLLLMRRRTNWKLGILAGIAAGLAAWLQIQMIAYITILAVVWIVDRVIASRWRDGAWMILAGGIALVISAPLLIETFRSYPGLNEMAGGTVVQDYYIYRNRISTLILPTITAEAFAGPEINLLGWLSQWLRDSGLPIHLQGSSYFGWMPLILGFIGWRSKLPGTRFLAAVWLVFTLLSLGPVISLFSEPDMPGEPLFGIWWIPGPFYFLKDIPPIGLLRTPERYDLVAQICLGLLSGFGFLRIMRLGWLRGRALLQSLALSGIFALHIIDMNLPNDFAPSQYSPFWEEIAEEPGDFAVLDLPYSRGAHQYMHYGAYHEKGVIWGFASRMPLEELEAAEQALRFPLIATGGPETWPSDYPRFAQGLIDYNVRYLIVHKKHLNIDIASAQPEFRQMGEQAVAIIEDPVTWENQTLIEPPQLIHDGQTIRAYRITPLGE